MFYPFDHLIQGVQNRFWQVVEFKTLSILLFALPDQKRKVGILCIKNELWHPVWDLLQQVAMIIALSKFIRVVSKILWKLLTE